MDGDYWMFESNSYDHKGYMYKDFVLSAIVSHNPKPPIHIA